MCLQHWRKSRVRRSPLHRLPKVRISRRIFTSGEFLRRHSLTPPPPSSIIFYLDNSGTLGLFAGLNVLAFVLVFLLVEETKRRTLEDLDLVFAVRKREFMKFQVETYLPWFFRHYLLRKDREEKEKPSLYIDFTWDAQVDGSMMRNVDTSETTHPHEGIPRESGLDDEQIGPTDIEHEPERQDSDSEDSLHR